MSSFSVKTSYTNEVLIPVFFGRMLPRTRLSNSVSVGSRLNHISYQQRYESRFELAELPLLFGLQRVDPVLLLGIRTFKGSLISMETVVG